MTASYDGVELTTTVTVLAADHVPAVAGLSKSEVLVGPEATVEITVTLDTPAPPGGQAVDLASDALDLDLPVITVPEGATEVTFTLTAGTETGTATVTVSTPTGSAELAVEVTDIPPVGLLLVEVVYDVSSTDDGQEWVMLYNGTGADVDLSGYSIGYGGSSYTWGGYQLSGTVANGECFVAGGPTANANNGSPTFDQSVAFSPGIQNSGNDADGIALFDVLEADITSSTVPIDAVVYGWANTNGLIGPDGMPVAAPHVGDVQANSSMVRTSLGTWEISSTPYASPCIVITE